MIKKFGDFVSNTVNEGKEQLTDLKQYIQSMCKTFKSGRYEEKRGIFVIDKEHITGNTYISHIKHILKSEKNNNEDVTYCIVDEIKDETSLYKTLCIEKNSFIIFTKNAVEEMFSNKDIFNMIKNAVNSDYSERELFAPDRKGKEFYSQDNLIAAGMFPSNFVFNGFIIMSTTNDEMEDIKKKHEDKYKILSRRFTVLSE